MPKHLPLSHYQHSYNRVLNRLLQESHSKPLRSIWFQHLNVYFKDQNDSRYDNGYKAEYVFKQLEQAAFLSRKPI